MKHILQKRNTMKDICKWDIKYIQLAKHISTWSKDPSRQIGCVAIGEKGQVLSTGYNGFPRDVIDHKERLNNREIKYQFTIHAEANTIYNATYNGVCLNNSTMYVYGLFVCNECAKAIAQCGINRVVMAKVNVKGWETSCANALNLFDECGIKYDFIDLQYV
jgi:dCMP deaminase